jgi:hypothetical protein
VRAGRQPGRSDHPPTAQRRETHHRLLAQAVVAEQAGFHLFQVGEHHFNHYTISAPFVALAAIAAHTETIRLGTGVTLITTCDPVVVAEDAATLDVMSGGRAEVAVGRGIHQAIFDAMDRPSDRATEIMAEATELLTRLLTEESVTWRGASRAPLDDVTIRPRPIQQPIPVWSGFHFLARVDGPARAAGDVGRGRLSLRPPGPHRRALPPGVGRLRSEPIGCADGDYRALPRGIPGGAPALRAPLHPLPRQRVHSEAEPAPAGPGAGGAGRVSAQHCPLLRESPGDR